MKQKILTDCEHLSSESKITFPEVVKKLIKAGVETYYVDLIKRRNTYYGTDGRTEEVMLSLKDLPFIAESFDVSAVHEAVKHIQRQEISYPEFINEIMKAGTYGYIAYLRGRRVVYLGRTGEMHIEHFPPAPVQ